ncbi:MAG: hypothetical protein WB756_18655, partial [Xanthobacteraceae bacterium]
RKADRIDDHQQGDEGGDEVIERHRVEVARRPSNRRISPVDPWPEPAISHRRTRVMQRAEIRSLTH